ncbi:FecR family protein [Parapedobacter deserti]|uniref:FecR family protein n=1 Tax=Parapedobacter deserti TaxID=1912957 RepID=A0ABV7JGJ2_9SPHI
MKKHIRYLFQQYLHNRASRQELEAFFHIINSARYDRELAALLKETYETLKREFPSLTYIDADGRLNFLQTGEPRTTKRLSTRKRVWIGSAAAAVILAASIGIGHLAPRLTTPQGRETVQVIRQAASDENKVIQLSDGTTVWLNSSSKLEYPQHFERGKPREVSLIGEAYFEVERAEEWPFIVHAAEVKTSVLGTAFNVKAYPGSAAVTVAVKHGKVAVSKSGEPLAVLKDNQELRIPLATQDHPVLERQLSSKVAGNWKAGYLDYEDETIATVIADLERFYGIQVTLEDQSLADEEITISLRRDSRPEYAISILCRLIDKQYVKQENMYIIH